ncbi:hypothetical protein TIFTF001_030672 [Ficus carica]|uniref:Uncharacterized protein n=1 Tax=Ficus carica TaxID=3494 RepID=A0AA88DTU2_FICCA|nr:hypothetical protein TIFTF001_030672 [Ficus carica]
MEEIKTLSFFTRKVPVGGVKIGSRALQTIMVIGKVSPAKGVVELVEDYFVDVFSTSLADENSTGAVLDGITTRISSEIRMALSTRFSENDVKEALLDMAPWKFPGRIPRFLLPGELGYCGF